jgi:hypothetical protein
LKSLKAALSYRQITTGPVSLKELLQLFQADSLKALLLKMGPFDPATHAFQFGNPFDLTVQQAEQARGIIPGVILDLVHLTCINEIRKELESVELDLLIGSITLLDVLGGSDFLTTRLSLDAFVEIAGVLVAELTNPLVSGGGYCGGLAFGGYDFYLQGWPVNSFGLDPTTNNYIAPSTGELHDYLFQRLLDSLEFNGATFIEWWTKIHVLPHLDDWLSEVVLATAGSIGGPAGIALGLWIGDRVDLFDLGGPSLLLKPTKDQWSTIRERLDKEAAWPIGLIFDNKPNLFDQHQILAIHYTDNGSGMATLDIWDNKDVASLNPPPIPPNPPRPPHHVHPQTLELDFRGDELKITGAITDDNLRIKGIFLEEYTARQPPLSLGPQ